MGKIKLTKREYMGVGYYHRFANIETGKTLKVYCSKEEYNDFAFSINGGSKLVIPEGYTHIGSAGGVVLVDTPSKEILKGEGVIVGDKYFVGDVNFFGEDSILCLSEEEFNNKYIWQ